MNGPHSAYEDVARERRGSEEYHQGYAEARQAFLIGQAVRERRLALGLSQAELATRAQMTQPALSRLEAGGVVPTIRVLERISTALSADLVVNISPHAAALREVLDPRTAPSARRPACGLAHGRRCLPFTPQRPACLRPLRSVRCI